MPEGLDQIRNTPPFDILDQPLAETMSGTDNLVPSPDAFLGIINEGVSPRSRIKRKAPGPARYWRRRLFGITERLHQCIAGETPATTKAPSRRRGPIANCQEFFPVRAKRPTSG